MQEIKRLERAELFPQKQCKESSLNEHPAIQDDIHKVIESEGYINYKVFINKIPQDGGNYLAELFEIDIKGDTKKGHQETSLFMKKKFEHIDVIDALSIFDAYAREKYLYNTVFKCFTELQDGVVPKDKQYNTLKYYETDNPDTIIMENLSRKGYKLFDTRKPITLQYADECIKEIAKFHALSFAIEKQRPNLFEDIKNLRSVFTFTNGFKTCLNNFVNAGIDVMDTDDKKTRVQKVIFPLLDKLESQFNYKENAVNCLCHDDYRVSNIKIKEKDGIIVKAIPLDYQLTHYGPPLKDLIYLIFTCAVEKGFRRKHIQHFKDLYYSELSDFLQYFKLDVIEIYPRKDFDEDYERLIMEYGFVRAFNLMPFAMPPEEEYPDILDMSTIQVVKSDLYVMQMNELVDDFVEWGYI